MTKLRLAIVGAGPAGIYAADILLKTERAFEVSESMRAVPLALFDDHTFNRGWPAKEMGGDVPDTAFDECGKKAIKDLAEANEKGTLYGSMSQGYASPAAIKNAMYDVITREYNGDIDATEAAKELADAVAAAKG